MIRRVEVTGEVQPPPEFVRDLKAIDDRFDVQWCAMLDGLGRWYKRWRIVFHNPNGLLENCMTVEKPRYPDEDIGGYQPLDSRTIHRLKLYDTARRRPQDIFAEIDRIEEQLIEETDADARRELEGIADYCRRELLGTPQIHSGWEPR